jgi:hypothetical protein
MGVGNRSTGDIGRARRDCCPPLVRRALRHSPKRRVDKTGCTTNATVREIHPFVDDVWRIAPNDQFVGGQSQHVEHFGIDAFPRPRHAVAEDRVQQ